MSLHLEAFLWPPAGEHPFVLCCSEWCERSRVAGLLHLFPYSYRYFPNKKPRLLCSYQGIVWRWYAERKPAATRRLQLDACVARTGDAVARLPTFFHPDYTVGPGTAPGPALRLA